MDLGGKARMEKEEFIKNYCEKSHLTRKEYDKDYVALPCNCGNPDCKGWATITKTGLAIKTHIATNG